MTAQEMDRLLVLATNGDMKALEALYGELREPVYALALSLLRNASAAEDVVQDTFVKLALCSGRFQPRGYGRAFVLKIARNLALRQLQQASRLAPLEDSGPLEVEESMSLDRLVLHEALTRLNEAERQIVLLHSAGLKHEEIGRLLRRPAATVRWKYAQAVKKLAVYLEEKEEPDHDAQKKER